MATSSPPAGNSMRQQLDELDALLQRMLTLPVTQTDDGEPTAPTNGMSEKPPAPPKGGPRLVLLDGSAPVPTPQSPPPATWDAHWNINLNPQQGSSILGPRSPAAAVQPPVFRAETVAFVPSRPEPVPQPPMSMPTPPSDGPVVRTEPLHSPPRRSPVEAPAPLPLLPFVALNRAFDAVMLCLGTPGQWFCTSAGRNMLGYAGLGVLFASVALAAGWVGWPR
jgi:hypothetical protein